MDYVKSAVSNYAAVDINISSERLQLTTLLQGSHGANTLIHINYPLSAYLAGNYNRSEIKLSLDSYRSIRLFNIVACLPDMILK